jgi:hypothetical protein
VADRTHPSAWRGIVVVAVAGAAIALPAVALPAAALADPPVPHPGAAHGNHHGHGRPGVRHGRGGHIPVPTPDSWPTPDPEDAPWRAAGNLATAGPQRPLPDPPVGTVTRPPEPVAEPAARQAPVGTAAPTDTPAAMPADPATTPAGSAIRAGGTTPTPGPQPAGPHLALDLPGGSHRGTSSVPAGLLPLAGLALMALLIAVGFRVRQQVTRVD